MSDLKAHHLTLLSDLVRRGGAPAGELDGRRLRPLKAAGLVVEWDGRVIPTAAGRDLPQGDAPTNTTPLPTRGDAGVLSDAGGDALRMICRQDGGALADHLDGRVLRALLTRRFVVEEGGWVLATAEGRAYYQEHIRKRRRTLSQFDRTIAGARAAVLHKHIDGLEGALPPGVELKVGDLPCHVDDILAALRGYARTLERPTTRGAS